MVQTTVNTATFLADAILFLRDNLDGGVSGQSIIVDPLTRTGNEKFILTAYPKRPARYPILTVIDKAITDQRPGGFRSETMIVTLVVEVRIWARNVLERDQLTQQVTNRLRDIQYATGGTNDAGLYDFRIGSIVNIDEPDESGEVGVRSKAIEIAYTLILQGS